jgi:hypothetical protein
MHFRFSLPRKKPVMSITRVFRKSPGALAVTCLALFATSVRAQAPQPPPTSLEREVQEMRTENNAIREHLGKLEEQQKTILQLMDELQRKLDGRPDAIAHQSAPAPQPEPVPVDGGTATDVSLHGKPIVPSTTADASAPAANAALNDPLAVTNSASTSVRPASVAPLQTNDVRYRDGIVIWQTREDAKVPFLLNFNVNTQIRYLNTLDSQLTFTDHLGVTRDVHTRNDITVNRAMFILGGYIFDKRLRYSFTVWTSAGSASIVVASNIGWQFGKALTITGGYTGVPGSRSLVATFPFFTATDRSMADNFFRPGFTQGIWANGEPVKGLNYLMFVGNGLNTLNISANKIDTHLMFSGSVWWEPLGPYGEPGKSRNMYDDYFASKKVRIRIGTAFTRSREDRFSNLEQSNPDNTSLYNSDGVLTFSTGAFAPGVTVDKATYRMWAIDGGIKWNGLAINGQYYFRRLNDFEANGPLPLASTFDHGFELSASQFVIPKKLIVYGRGSRVFGQFGDSWEYAGGVKWHLLPTERLWFSAEMMRVHKAPYSGAFTPYTAGMSGWAPMIQSVIAF